MKLSEINFRRNIIADWLNQKLFVSFTLISYGIILSVDKFIL